MKKISWKSDLIQMIICLFNKMLKIHMLTVIVRSVFEEGGK